MFLNKYQEMLDRFVHYRQLDSMDCGPTCLRMIAKAYGETYTLPFLREKCYIDKAGDLASRLQVSKSTIYDIIYTMKNMGQK